MTALPAPAVRPVRRVDTVRLADDFILTDEDWWREPAVLVDPTFVPAWPLSRRLTPGRYCPYSCPPALTLACWRGCRRVDVGYSEPRRVSLLSYLCANVLCCPLPQWCSRLWWRCGGGGCGGGGCGGGGGDGGRRQRQRQRHRQKRRIPPYVFDSDVGWLRGHFTVPPALHGDHCQFEVCPLLAEPQPPPPPTVEDEENDLNTNTAANCAVAQRPQYTWVLIGCRGTGGRIHTDHAGTSAWNALVVGRKRWTFFPPSTPAALLEDLPEGHEDERAQYWYDHKYADVVARVAEVAEVARVAAEGERAARAVESPDSLHDSVAVESPDSLHDSIEHSPCGANGGVVEVIQEAGEVVYIPHGWYGVMTTQVYAHTHTLHAAHARARSCTRTRTHALEHAPTTVLLR